MKSFTLPHSILSTISFFNALSYPLTVAEIEEFLMFFTGSTKAMDIITALDLLESRGMVKSADGMYTVPHRTEIIKDRLATYASCEKKYRIARQATRVLACIPFVRMICVVNSLAMNNAHEESDIDFFIVTKKKRIWLTRFLVVALLDVLGKRPRGNMRKNMICTCFFASEDALDFSALQIPPLPDRQLPDLYLAWWASRFVPLYDEGGYAEKMFSVNEWAKGIFPRRRLYRTIQEHRVGLPFFGGWIKRIGEFLVRIMGRASEHLARAIQIRILPKSLRALCNRDTRVVMNDQILKFHVRDMREEIRAKWYNTCKTYDINFF
ncbi:nucleotidyltransferase domain-containing protein [Candidatus Uhrbacteria bacterium]|nr:nucleotidyltransferase domain-containing protein [Candidatus Uhrbacteria bacterium]